MGIDGKRLRSWWEPRPAMAFAWFDLHVAQHGEMNDTQYYFESALVVSFLVSYVGKPGVWAPVNVDDVIERMGWTRSRFMPALYDAHFYWAISAKAHEGGGKPDKNDEWVDVRLPDTFYLRQCKWVTCRPSLPPGTRERVHERFNRTCVYCGEPSEEIDHVIPVSKGGSDDESNLVASCTTCNRTKSDRLLSELGWLMEYANV